MKSNLNLPLKFLIRLSSSCLPKTAIEVASLSKYFLAAILVTFEKIVLISWIHVVCIVSEAWALVLEIRCR